MPCDTLLFHLLSDDFDDDTFGALPIEFAVEEALPTLKVDPTIGDSALPHQNLTWACSIGNS